MISDAELLARVTKTSDFFQAVVYRDAFDDWNLVRDFGEFLVRILPDSEIMGHALLVRAYRHLGDKRLALDQLEQCKEQTVVRKLEPWEVEMLLPLLTEEERLLSNS